MSEYQYYEFQAVDRPLTEREMRELRAYSTRATITPSRFVNHYEWGSFKGNPSAWMERYFDAFLYFANWGTHELMLRLPRRILDLDTAKGYCHGESASVRAKGEFVILEFHSQDEDGDWEDGGEGWLSSLMPLRADIAGGDYRTLYLAWLLCAQAGELDDDATEPTCPPGLAALTAPLKAFTDFLRVNRDLVAVAAKGNAGVAELASREELASYAAALSDNEKTDFLIRLVWGDQPHLRAELLRRFRKAGDGATTPSGIEPRTVAELVASAERRTEERRREEAKQAAKERTRREHEEAAARERYLKDLAGRESETWRKIDVLIATKRPSDYDEAVRLLKDLRDLAARGGRAAEAVQRITRLRDAHARKPTFVERLRRAGLLAGARP